MIEETSQFYEDETVSMALAATKLLAEEIINLLINYPIVGYAVRNKFIGRSN